MTESKDFKTIEEGSVTAIEEIRNKDVSRDMEVFYNPLMSLNRDISIAVLDKYLEGRKEISEERCTRILLPLEASGVRGIRFLKELKNENKIEYLILNDLNEKAINLMRKNFELNDLDEHICKDEKYRHRPKEELEPSNGKLKVYTTNREANRLLLSVPTSDYIDIDPFGSPNEFLDASIKRIRHKGILAITATDTAPLAGTYPKAGRRKYYADSIRNEHKHEIGLRILIRKCQLIGSQYAKALVPVVSYYKDHYFRIFFMSFDSKGKSDALIDNHKHITFCKNCLRVSIVEDLLNANTCKCEKKDLIIAGPMYTGKLQDEDYINFVKEHDSVTNSKNTKKFLDILAEESKVDNILFYEMSSISSLYGVSVKRDKILLELNNNGFFAARSHAIPSGIKTSADIDELIQIMKKLQK